MAAKSDDARQAGEAQKYVDFGFEVLISLGIVAVGLWWKPLLDELEPPMIYFGVFLLGSAFGRLGERMRR